MVVIIINLLIFLGGGGWLTHLEIWTPPWRGQRTPLWRWTCGPPHQWTQWAPWRNLQGNSHRGQSVLLVCWEEMAKSHLTYQKIYISFDHWGTVLNHFQLKKVEKLWTMEHGTEERMNQKLVSLSLTLWLRPLRTWSLHLSTSIH